MQETVHMLSSQRLSSQRLRLRLIAIFAVFALLAAACGGADSADGEDADALAVPTPVDTRTEAEITADATALAYQETLPTADELEEQLAQQAEPTPLPTVPPELFATPVPTPEPETPEDPWEVHVLIAKSDTVDVPVFDEPEGDFFQLQYEYLDGSKVNYPLRNPTYFGNDLALMVLEGEPGDDWAKVQLPVRPNGKTAWVQTGFFDWNTHNYHIDINVTDNWVKVWEGEELIVETEAITGRPGRETPVVTAYIDEIIDGPTAAYGPYILSIAAFSETLNIFSSGLPKLALHGTNEPEKMGQFVSSGCIRVENDIITLIAETVPVGTAVDIFS